MKLDLRKYAPPGLELKTEGKMLAGGLILSFFFSLSFFLFYSSEYNQLYYWQNGPERVKVWIDHAMMPPFPVILRGTLTGFWITAVVMLSFIAVHYGYHHQGSKSVYLMRRLPDKWERHRRCVTLPVLAAVLVLLCALVTMLLYYGFYMIVTPDRYIPQHQWQKIWRDLR